MAAKTGMGKKEAKLFYDLLLKKKQELLKGIEHIANDALKTSQRDATGDLSAYSLHMADVATDNYDREFSLSLADNEQKLLNRINAALEKIDGGAFGLCELCEKKDLEDQAQGRPVRGTVRSVPRETREEKTLTLLVIPLVFAVDRILKIYASLRLNEGQSIPVWPGVFHLTRVNNTGAAFGLWHGATWALAAFSALSVALIVVYLAGGFPPKADPPPAGGWQVRNALAWTFIAGGALGNLYDRLRFGYVIDYADFRVWPVFNLADACISLGITWILFCFLRRPHVPGPD